MGEGTVSITKLKTNYEVRYDYNKMLTEYIKTFPKEHRNVRVDNVIGLNGEKKDDWVRLIRDAQIGNLIMFLMDNNIEFKLENLTSYELNEIKKTYKDRQDRIKNALKLKNDSLEVTTEPLEFMKLQPYEYQKKAVKFFEINKGVAILGDEPGIGKSATAIAYAAKHRKKTLIICPASLKLMWKDEIAKFLNEEGHIFKYYPSKRSKDKNPDKEKSLFNIINFESIQTFIKLEYKYKCQGNKYNVKTSRFEKCGYELLSIEKKIKDCPHCGSKKSLKSSIHGIQYFESDKGEFIDPDDYDLIVIDEFHRIKNQATDWTQIIKRAFQIIPEKLLLSGTAIKSRPMEFFSSLNFIDSNMWNNRHEFGIRYCAGFENPFGWVYDGVSNTEELFNRISPFYLRRLKKDVLKDLPEKTYTEIRTELSSSEMKEYTRLEKATKKVLDKKTGKEKDEEKSFMEKIHELKQFTEKVKLNRASEFIHDVISSKGKVVVFFDYLETAKMFKKEFGDAAVLHTGEMGGEEKHKAVHRFQNDKSVHVFGGTILSAGVGITLTAANKLIFIGQAWTTGDMTQCEDRIHRATTTHDNIQIITYLCQDTIDMMINDMLKTKAQVVSKVLDGKDHQRNISIVTELIGMLKKQIQ